MVHDKTLRRRKKRISIWVTHRGRCVLEKGTSVMLTVSCALQLRSLHSLQQLQFLECPPVSYSRSSLSLLTLLTCIKGSQIQLRNFTCGVAATRRNDQLSPPLIRVLISMLLDLFRAWSRCSFKDMIEPWHTAEALYLERHKLIGESVNAVAPIGNVHTTFPWSAHASRIRGINLQFGPCRLDSRSLFNHQVL